MWTVILVVTGAPSATTRRACVSPWPTTSTRPTAGTTPTSSSSTGCPPSAATTATSPAGGSGELEIQIIGIKSKMESNLLNQADVEARLRAAGEGEEG